MKKNKIMEILDDKEIIIGTDDKPKVDNNIPTQSKFTTDKAVKISHQPFDDKFWGTFGFSLYENKGSSEFKDQLAELMFEKFKEWVSTLDKNMDDFDKWKNTALKSFNELTDNEKKNDYKWADKIIELIKSTKKEKSEKTLSEEEMKKIAEDIITKRNDKSVKSKKEDKEIVGDKIKIIKDLFSDLSDAEKGDLIDILKKK